MPTDAKNARWVCLECHWIYDPAKGDPKERSPCRNPLGTGSGYLALS